MMQRNRWPFRAVCIAILGGSLVIFAEACSFEIVFHAYLGNSFWKPAWKYVSELADGLPREKTDYLPYAGISSTGGGADLQKARDSYQAIFSYPQQPYSNGWSWPEPVLTRLRDLVRSTVPANAAEADELGLLTCKVELRALKSGRDEAALTPVHACFESYLAQPRPPALASEARGWLARTEYLGGKGALASKIYLSELASVTSNIRRERLLASLHMVWPQEGELDEYFDTPAHALFAANQITSEKNMERLAAPLIAGLERHNDLFGQGAESDALAIALMRASIRMGAPESTLRYADRIPPNAAMRQSGEYNWLVGTARFQQKDYPGAEAALLKVLSAADADLRQKTLAANGLIGVYGRMNRPLDQLWMAFQAEVFMRGAVAGDDMRQAVPLYPSYYYELSQAGAFGYLDFDVPYLLDAQLTDAELEEAVKRFVSPIGATPRLAPASQDIIRYASGVRYARREKYEEAAQIFDQLRSPRASKMKQAARLFADTKSPGVSPERQLEALYDYAEFLSDNEDEIFFNDTLWHRFQTAGFYMSANATDDSDLSARLERRLRDDQEEYWKAYQILNQVVEQAGATPLGRKAAERAILCLRRIQTARFGRSEEIKDADLRLSAWLEKNR